MTVIPTAGLHSTQNPTDIPPTGLHSTQEPADLLTQTPSTVVSPPASSTPKLSGPYLGQIPPGVKPVLFAPGIISSPDFHEYSGAFSPDGIEYYFYRFSTTTTAVLLYSKVFDGVWSEPKQLEVSADYMAFEPYVTMDNSRLYFAWGHPVPPGKPEFPYFFVERTQEGWSEPTYAGQGMFLSSTLDGQLYTTDMSTRSRDGRTYLARIILTDGVFTGYERLNITPPLGNPAHPCIAPDGSYILFDVEIGGHLFISFKRADGTWGEPIDLTEHGFDRNAGGAYISPDGNYLFFALNHDIWWVDIRVVENLRPTDKSTKVSPVYPFPEDLIAQEETGMCTATGVFDREAVIVTGDASQAGKSNTEKFAARAAKMDQ